MERKKKQSSEYLQVAEERKATKKAIMKEKGKPKRKGLQEEHKVKTVTKGSWLLILKKKVFLIRLYLDGKKSRVSSKE